MNRKLFWIVTLLLLDLGTFAEAQQANKVAQIGILDSGTASDPRNALGRDAFRQGLRDLGYVEGKNINIEYRYDEGKSGRLPQLAEELVRLKVDIIVVNNSTAALAAKKSTATIPVVFTTGANPVTTGLVATLARPGGNVTGLTTNFPELVGKRLGLLKEAVPKVSRFAYLMPADTLTIRAQFDEAQGTAKALGVQFQAVEVKAPNPDFEGAFRFMAKERIGGLVTEGPPLIALHQKRILGLAEKYRLPAIHTEQEWANEGGLMSYGANRSEPYRRAAVFVDRILKGTRPADRLTGLGRKALAVTADVGVATQVSQLFDTVRTEFGRLDILVNNAGLWFRKPFLEISDSEWDLVLTTNLKGTFLCTQQAARIMMPQKSGCIINIASHAGLFYSRGQGVHYAASKAGIIQLTRVLAFELGPFQIRINAIAPGGINTPGSSDAKPSKLEPGVTIENQYSATNPLGRRGEPEDISHAALFLASPMASFMTGQTLVVNGGSIAARSF